MNTLLLVPFLLTAADLEPRNNFAENFSFELDRDRNGEPDGWQGSAFASPARLGWDHQAARTGTHTVWIADSLGHGDSKDWKNHTGRWTTARGPIVPGTEYTLEVWVKTEGVTGQAAMTRTWMRKRRRRFVKSCSGAITPGRIFEDHREPRALKTGPVCVQFSTTQWTLCWLLTLRLSVAMTVSLCSPSVNSRVFRMISPGCGLC